MSPRRSRRTRRGVPEHPLVVEPLRAGSPPRSPAEQSLADEVSRRVAALYRPPAARSEEQRRKAPRGPPEEQRPPCLPGGGQPVAAPSPYDPHGGLRALLRDRKADSQQRLARAAFLLVRAARAGTPAPARPRRTGRAAGGFVLARGSTAVDVTGRPDVPPAHAQGGLWVPPPLGHVGREPGAPWALHVVDFALAQVGKPSVRGARGPVAYDGVGLARAAWALAGVELPTAMEALIRYGTPLDPLDLPGLRPGDLLFFHGDRQRVGVWTGGGTVVHVAGGGDPVREDGLGGLNPGYARSVR
ncbi:hypothetical protein ACFWIA_01810 [Streptomyces sp. NPDC127068]|uniref:C40 family peptidase n=1 Tax=Streptomyces sp. NPDC127068 TaxID=3347127 RepID=UPI00365809F3